jgi:hypothetical protein
LQAGMESKALLVASHWRISWEDAEAGRETIGARYGCW